MLPESPREALAPGQRRRLFGRWPFLTSTTSVRSGTVCVPQPSTNPAKIEAYGSPSCGDFNTPCVDSLGDRMANRLTYNNFSIAGIDLEFLTASHVVMESATNQSTGIRYYILGVSNGKAFPLINSGSGGEVGPADLADPNHTLFYFMPSAALDKYGNLGMTYTVSGSYCSTCRVQPNPAVYFDLLPLGISNFGQLNLIVAGTGDEEGTYHWGEYAATVIDPTDARRVFAREVVSESVRCAAEDRGVAD